MDTSMGRPSSSSTAWRTESDCITPISVSTRAGSTATKVLASGAKISSDRFDCNRISTTPS